MEDTQRSLMTVRQFAQRHPAFPEGGLRYSIFHAKTNGFEECIRRIGRKILIDESAFFRWVDSQDRDGSKVVENNRRTLKVRS